MIADHLAESPLEYQLIKFELPDKDLLAVIEDFNGAINIHGYGVGAVLASSSGRQFPIAVKLAFNFTNNMAEFEACITGLQAAISLGVKFLKVYGDLAASVAAHSKL